MPLLRFTALISSLALALGIGTASVSAQPVGAPPPDFGTPPSGEIPILFNDHHVYAKPDRLTQNRVLAALVRGNTILVPLRSMFEQTGATVSYDPASKTVDVSKPGSDVKVTVGRPEVVINGETRPLDVPPEIYRGTVVVPVRVISEGMGAYVQWVPDRRIVVVRYVAAAPPTPPPPPPATPPPTPPPTPTPTPTPTPKPPYEDKFIVGDYIVKPTVYNEFSGNNAGNNFVGSSFAGRAGLEFTLAKFVHLMAEANGMQYQYKHVGFRDNTVPRNTTCGPALAGEPGCVTTIGAKSSVYVPSFLALDRDIDARLGWRFSQPRLYVVASYYWHNTNYGYPQLHSPGFGLEKLPDFERLWSVFGSYMYYPNAKGAFSDPGTGVGYDLTYKIQKFEGGVTLRLVRIGGPASVFLEGGFIGDRGDDKFFAPSGFRHYGGFAGLGANF